MGVRRQVGDWVGDGGHKGSGPAQLLGHWFESVDGASEAREAVRTAGAWCKNSFRPARKVAASKPTGTSGD
jgi:hypothetical protein